MYILNMTKTNNTNIPIKFDKVKEQQFKLFSFSDIFHLLQIK